MIEWDATAWAAEIAASLSEVVADEALVAAVHAVCPSPPWHEPTWARRLAVEVPRLAVGACGVRALPSIGMSLEDVLGELQATLIARSQSPASRWDPSRGRTSWTGWACMVIKSRWLNLLRNTRSGHVSCISYANEIGEDWSADRHILDEDNSPWLSSKGRPSRAGLRKTGRPMGRPRKHPKPPPVGCDSLPVGA